MGKALKYLKKSAPEVHERFLEIREDNPRAAKRLLRRYARAFRHAQRSGSPQAKKALIRQIKARFKTRALIKKYKRAENSDEKERLKAKIKSSLEKLFDAKISNQEATLKRMKKRLSRMEERIAKRRKAKGSLIERRLNVVTGEEATFDW